MRFIKGILITATAVVLLAGGCSSDSGYQGGWTTITIDPTTIYTMPTSSKVEFRFSGSAPTAYIVYIDAMGEASGKEVSLPHKVTMNDYRELYYVVSAAPGVKNSGTVKIEVYVNGKLVATDSTQGNDKVELLGVVWQFPR